MAEDVYMDVNAVQTMQKRFQDVHSVLEKVATILKWAGNAVLAFSWLGIGLAAKQYIDYLEDLCKKLADETEKISTGIQGAIRSYRDGDNSGSTLFT
jgi:hypothetical protein